jgi:hypothetical protein
MLDANQTFNALIREATFTKEVLCAGATQIRKANYSTPGVYAQAFAALSLGLERIGKLCLMLDHYIENSGRFPDFNYLKNNIGHKLDLLQARASEIVDQRQMKFQFLDALNRPIDLAILQVLHDYAGGDRYSNINILIGAKQKNDPISAWFDTVDSYIFDNVIGQRRKITIRHNANLVHEMMSKVGVVRHTAESGETIDSYVDASFRTGMFKAVAPYRQFYVLQIIRYWVELLWHLGDTAQSLGRQEIPFFGEIFGGFYNDDAFFKSRTTWNF